MAGNPATAPPARALRKSRRLSTSCRAPNSPTAEPALAPELLRSPIAEFRASGGICLLLPLARRLDTGRVVRFQVAQGELDAGQVVLKQARIPKHRMALCPREQ